MAETASRRRGRWRPIVATVLLLLVASMTWVAVRGVLARRELLRARDEVQTLRATVVDSDASARQAVVRRVKARTHRAVRLTGDVVWRAYAKFPVIGRTLRGAHELVEVADQLSTQVIEPLVAVADQLDPAVIRPAGDQIAIAPLQQARPAVLNARDAVLAVRESALAVSHRGTLWVGSARSDLIEQLDTLQVDLGAVGDALEVAPTLLGGDRPRRYFLAVQNPAEARGSGGLIGSYGVITADRGRLHLDHIGPDSELISDPAFTVPTAPDFKARYHRFASDYFWLNANMSPHLPYTNAVITGLYEHLKGVRLDGTIAFDPIAMSYLLEATGPVPISTGGTIDAKNVVQRTLSESYALYKTEAERDKFFGAVAQATYQALTSSGSNTSVLLHALARAASEGHLQIASNEPAVEAALERMPAGGAITTAPGPYLAVVVNNAAGSKLDYYLRRSIRYELRKRADGPGGVATVEVTLRNLAPPKGLPEYVTRRPDLAADQKFVPGQNRLFVSVYAGVGATLSSASVGRTPFAKLEGVPGEPLVLGSTATTLEVEKEREHAVFSTFLDIDPGGEVTLRLVIQEPLFRPDVVVRSQPLVVPDELEVDIR